MGDGRANEKINKRKTVSWIYMIYGFLKGTDTLTTKEIKISGQSLSYLKDRDMSYSH